MKSTPVSEPGVIGMNEPSIAIKWLLLDNLKNRWLYSTNIQKEAADVALQWAIEYGYVNYGRITGAGEVWLRTNLWRC